MYMLLLPIMAGKRKGEGTFCDRYEGLGFLVVSRHGDEGGLFYQVRKRFLLSRVLDLIERRYGQMFTMSVTALVVVDVGFNGRQMGAIVDNGRAREW